MSRQPSTDASLPAVLASSPATYPLIAQDATPVRPRRRRTRTGQSVFGTELPPTALHTAASMASMLPKFSGLDVNFWLFVFSWRYRKLVRKWDNRINDVPSEKRVNWVGRDDWIFMFRTDLQTGWACYQFILRLFEKGAYRYYHLQSGCGAWSTWNGFCLGFQKGISKTKINASMKMYCFQWDVMKQM